MAMFAEYRNEIYRSRKWAPESEEDDQMEDFQDLENKQEKENPVRRSRSGKLKPRDVRSWTVLLVPTAMGFLLPICQTTRR